MLKFILKNIEDIAPWSYNGKSTLSWFALTDSYYWFDFAGVQFPQYNEELLKNHNKDKIVPFIDYPFARIFSDICDILPYIAFPVPDEVFEYVNSIEKIEDYRKSLQQWLMNTWDESDEQYDLFMESAQGWLFSRKLDFGYLVGGPDLFIIRNKNEIHFYWTADFIDENGIYFWNTKRGKYSCGYNEFVGELLQCFRSFGYEMQKQILQCAKKPLGVEINLDQLQQNQIQYEDIISSTESGTILLADEPDWKNILEKIESIRNYI
ncbi:DUF5984 family protein [Paenibacillus sp. FSL E2-0178]|uniref:DUF5984 family protein n=1 Tax=Paenibacillus sp. FSL E2-0178 TaxID=2921361 RepID=UPI0031593502